MILRSIFTVDVATGQISRSINGAAVDDALAAVFYSRDKLPIGVRFVTGAVDVTNDLLSAGARLRVGIRRFTGTGVILAQADSYTIVDGTAQMVLDLDTAEMTAYMDALADDSNEKSGYFEIEVSSSDDTTERVTFAQQSCTLRCEVNMEGDEPPASGAPLNIRWMAGDTLPFRLTVKTDGQGEAIDSLDDHRLFFYLKLNPSSADSESLPQSKSTDAGTIQVLGTVASWKLSDDETAALPKNKPISFRVVIITPDDDKVTLRKGSITLIP